MKKVTGKRGCGVREPGGIYAELGLDEEGRPVEDFLIDPPIPVKTFCDDYPFKVSAQGITNLPGTSMFFDWVGLTHYPNVMDFIHEIKTMGLSRRIPKTFDFSLLDEEARLVLVHPRAYIVNRAAYTHKAWLCPCEKHNPGEFTEMCAGMWEWDIDPRTDIKYVFRDERLEAHGAELLRVRRKMPCGWYYGYATPDDVNPEYEPAVFASFPIARLVVVRDHKNEDASHIVTVEENLMKAGRATLPVEEVSS